MSRKHDKLKHSEHSIVVVVEVVVIVLLCVYLAEYGVHADLGYDPSAFKQSPPSSYYADGTECYAWHTTFIGNNVLQNISFAVPSFSTLQLRVWIVDPSSSSSSSSPDVQANFTDSVPSSSSSQLTQLFHNLGETPSISFFSITSSSSTPQISTPPAYNSTSHYWSFSFTTRQSNLIPMKVSGMGVSSVGCTVKDKLASLSIQVTPPLESNTKFTTLFDSLLSTTPFPSSISTLHNYTLRTSACSPNIAVILVSSSSFLFTQTAFTRTLLLSFSQPPLSTATLLDILPVNYGLVVLLPSSLYYVPLDGSTTPLLSKGFPSATPFPVTRISTPSNCDLLMEYTTTTATTTDPSILLNNVVFAWDDQNAVSDFYISTDGALTFTNIQITAPTATATATTTPTTLRWYIYSITLLHSNPYYVLLVKGAEEEGADSDCSCCILIYNYKTVTWSYGADYSSRVLAGSDGMRNMHVEAPVTGAGVIFTWGDRLGDLYYSPNGGFTSLPLQFLNTTDDDASSERIVALSTNPVGRMAVLTSSGKLLFGFVDATSKITLTSIPPSSSAFPSFDLFGDLAVIELTSSGITVNTTIITEVLTAASATTNNNSMAIAACPFLEFSGDFPPTHYIDMNEKVTANVKISLRTRPKISTYYPFGSNVVSMAVSDIDLLDFSMAFVGSSGPASPVSFYYAITLGERNVARYTTYQQRAHFAKGSADVRVNSLSYSLLCPYVQQVQRVHVGCPPSRRLVITTSSDGSLPTCENCAVRHYYGRLFRPILLLADDDGVEEVMVDYVIWEARGRDDYSFNLTARQAKCIIPAQTRKDFPSFKRADGTIDRAWGPATYHSCYDASKHKSVPDVPYEILNATSRKNAVVFSGGGDYVFRIRVVDPNYSYCDLTADIKVEVYGAPLSAGLSAAIVIATSVVIAASLVVSYTIYKKTQTHHISNN